MEKIGVNYTDKKCKKLKKYESFSVFSLGGFEEEEIVQDIGIVAAPVCSILFKSGIGIRIPGT